MKYPEDSFFCLYSISCIWHLRFPEGIKSNHKATPIGILVSGPVHSERGMRECELCHYYYYTVKITIKLYWIRLHDYNTRTSMNYLYTTK